MTSKCCVVLTDLGNFSGRTRSAVSVREGQGVVLMCSPPPHSPGTVPVFHVTSSLVYCLLILVDCNRGPQWLACAWQSWRVSTCMSSYWSYTLHNSVLLWFYCFLPILSTAVVVPLPPLVNNVWSRVQEPCEEQRWLESQNRASDHRVPCFTVELHEWWLMVLFAK